ncbi:response regulator [Vacuolonema iberomarrocanum]|uniref:response regulator n=1 Tax=Vacuolonema iberomarrocanum TaxID=3454632 RepID=UPI0019FE011B|nr:response regulator [filamentous cyanobacterium LEGE 07170]
MKILLIEDDDGFVKGLIRILKAHHYNCDHVKDGEAGWSYGSTFDYDLIIMELILPKLDGITLCQRFRAEGYDTPILLLTAQATNTAKVQGLDAGADDYVVKPFDSAELLARIRALLRRGRSNPMPLLSWGDLLLNPSTCEVEYKGQNLALTGKEYELLELMLRDSQHVFGVDELLENLWSSEDFPSEATMRSHIRRVRQKLVAIGAPHDFIATLHGRGYYLKPVETDAALATRPWSTSNTHASPAPNRHGDVASPPSHLEEQPFNTPSPIAHQTPHSAETQEPFLESLNKTWKTVQPQSLGYVEELTDAIAALEAGQLTGDRQAHAQQLASKLTESLSILGLQDAAHLARQLDHQLGSQATLSASQVALMHPLLHELQHNLQTPTHTLLAHSFQEASTRFLLISADKGFHHTLQAIAAHHGIEVHQTPPQVMDTPTIHADVILLHISAPATDEATPSLPSLPRCLQTLTQHYPTVPLLVMSDRLSLRDRLEIAQRGGQSLLNRTVSPEEILAVALRLWQGNRQTSKVMVIDDDPDWLGSLPNLLNPWRLKVTTLADAQEFWTVLQMVVPDVLVLGSTLSKSNLSEINGLELCQILRSDPHWQKLPILFLSGLSDASIQQKAFAVGADDYLCKPVHGGELARRILYRLRRIRAYTS